MAGARWRRWAVGWALGGALALGCASGGPAPVAPETPVGYEPQATADGGAGNPGSAAASDSAAASGPPTTASAPLPGSSPASTATSSAGEVEPAAGSSTASAPLPASSPSSRPAPVEPRPPLPGEGPRSAGEVAGAAWERALTAGQWPSREGHAAVVFAGRLWVLGGWGTGPMNDVWSSADGVAWRQEPDAAWAPRKGHAAAVFDGRIWVLGGTLGAEQAADVWSSPDGVRWTRVTDAAPWGPRTEHAVVVDAGRLVLAGGWSGGDRNDVWSSADGAHWTRLTEAAAWSPRNSLAAAVFRDRIWVLGGWGVRDSGAAAAAPVSGPASAAAGPDAEAAAPGSSSATAGPGAAAVGATGTVAGAPGATAPAATAASLAGNLADAWSSADGGRTWNRAAARVPWAPRNGHTAAVWRDRLWVLGGWGSRGLEEGNLSDVWSTGDGAAWRPATAQAPWLPRNGHTTAVFGGELWVLGGWSHFIGGSPVNDLWHTAGGG